jgi:hypothetical protein
MGWPSIMQQRLGPFFASCTFMTSPRVVQSTRHNRHMQQRGMPSSCHHRHMCHRARQRLGLLSEQEVAQSKAGRLVDWCV